MYCGRSRRDRPGGGGYSESLSLFLVDQPVSERQYTPASSEGRISLPSRW